MKLLVITGLPASGKTTLARQLAQRYSVPLITKDSIKEPLFDVLGADAPPQSRKLSDASFAVLFALARELLAARVDVVLEGNFRAGEHEPAFGALLPLIDSESSIAQVLCRIDEPVRLQRLTARATDPSRHPGHRDADLAQAAVLAQRDVLAASAFLSIPGQQFLYSGDDALLDVLDRWWGR